jgi:hypothetical protein
MPEIKVRYLELLEEYHRVQARQVSQVKVKRSGSGFALCIERIGQILIPAFGIGN